MKTIIFIFAFVFMFVNWRLLIGPQSGEDGFFYTPLETCFAKYSMIVRKRSKHIWIKRRGQEWRKISLHNACNLIDKLLLTPNKDLWYWSNIDRSIIIEDWSVVQS